ncbi:DUF695 domain-containing protein [Mucilaginibacter sp.]|uniref:DUF695 domain-containing protein n=1 Tax=Mucilaginibacter sp. TaxID=1882438 RepID=UPI0035BC816B
MAEILKLDDRWVGGEGVNTNGISVMVRYRPDMQHFINSGLYHTRMDMDWSYDDVGDSYMPSSGEMTLMESFEDALADAFSDNQSVLASIFTGDGTRKWLWYTQNSNEAAVRITALLDNYSEAAINFTRTEDPGWSAYFDLIADYDNTAV